MTVDYGFIGWCREDNHDKVWGYIELNAKSGSHGNYVTFWGRRGKKLQTKIYRDTYYWDLIKLSEAKTRKGYVAVDEAKLNEVYPEFEKDLEKMGFWAQFKI